MERPSNILANGYYAHPHAFTEKDVRGHPLKALRYPPIITGNPIFVIGRMPARWERCDTKSQAKAVYGRRKAEQREGKYFERQHAFPFREIAIEYIKNLEARQRRKGDDNSRINRWLTAFSDQDINTITIRQIEKVLTDLQAEGMQPATLLRHVTVLKAVFNRARRLGCTKDIPKVNNALVRYLTPDQELALLDNLPEKYRLLSAWPLILAYGRESYYGSRGEILTGMWAL
jgi:hypothetical protein